MRYKVLLRFKCVDKSLCSYAFRKRYISLVCKRMHARLMHIQLVCQRSLVCLFVCLFLQRHVFVCFLAENRACGLMLLERGIHVSVLFISAPSFVRSTSRLRVCFPVERCACGLTLSERGIHVYEVYMYIRVMNLWLLNGIQSRNSLK